VAGIASGTGAVHVGGNALMGLIDFGLRVASAIRADKCRVARGIRVASRAHAVCAAVIQAPEVMSECRAEPIGRRVTRCASGCNNSNGGGVRGEVIRNVPAERCGALPLSGVATVAIGWRHGGTDVAKIAGHSRVRPGQRETSRIVIEDRAQPRGRRVAGRAGRGIAGSNVIRHRAAQGRGALPIRSVAAVAISGESAAVISIHVAQRAGYGRVRAGQGEGCRAVIERGSRPVCRRVADRTVRRETRCDVIRYSAAQGRGALPGGQVAAIAGWRIQRVVVAHMAGRAWCGRRRDMHSSQCKPSRAVVKGCREEADGCVASRAVRHCK
jgi:hypothetical protein